jgi:3-hydroxyisobutyrate dehydrogenase-like beta-hydroxyacid dehydrogenase
MKVGFVGLGQMGKHMALNLASARHQLIVSDIRTDAFPEFQERGVKVTTDVRDVAEADIIFLSLPNGDVLKSALFGPSGMADCLRPGQIIIDTSTITYAATVQIAKDLDARGVIFLDAPVSGMEARAKDATLTFMCGGSRDTFETVQPLLAHMGNKILYMGGAGSGQLTKLINQLLFDINVAALAEILPMAAKMGLDPERVGEVVNSGTGRSYASEFFIPNILNGLFNAGYPMRAAYKDLVSGAEISANQGIPLPVLAAATATYQQALLKGHGDKDKGGMIHVFEELLGVQFRKTSAPIQ